MKGRILLGLGFAVATLLWVAAATRGQDAITNSDQIAAAFDQHWLSYPLASPCADDSTTLQPMDFWFLDFTTLTNAVAALTNSTAEMQNGVSAWRLRLIQDAESGEVVLKPAGSDVELLRIGASPNFVPFEAYNNLLSDFCIMSGRNPGPTAYDDLIADGYTSLDPPRIVMDVWVMSAADEDAYLASMLAAESGEGTIAGGRFMAMSEDEAVDSGDDSDPCSITNLTQPFFVTSIQQDTNHFTMITWPSCTMFRYLVQSTDQLSTNTTWSAQAYTSYVWGRPNTTTWTDTTTTASATVTQRFYRVQRLLASPIAAGIFHGRALTPDGKLWAWGYNEHGEMGDGVEPFVEPHRPFPGEVAPVTSCIGQTISNAVALAADGDDCSMAVDAQGTVWTWGEAEHGQLGNGTYEPNQPVPAPINGVSNVVSVAAGELHTLVLRADGAIFAWGDDSFDQLGVGGLSSGGTNSPIQSLVPTQTVVVAIAAGCNHSVALDATGGVWTWGNGGEGELGNGGTTNVTIPMPVTGISNVIAIAAGCDHTIALTADKKVWTWGNYTSGELGRSGENRAPGQVSTLSNVVAIAGGNAFTLAATSNGQVYAFGDNLYGQLGTNGIGSSSTPIRVGGISNAVLVSAHPSGSHSLAMTVDGGTNRFWGWGYNVLGQVGNGATTNQYTPAPLQFCTRCQRCVQLGTSGSFTAQCNGTLYLYFNDDQLAFGDNSGSYTVSFDGLSTNVNVLANNVNGVAVGIVTNGGVYSYSANGFCARDSFPHETDPDGKDRNGQLADCSSINITNAICPAWRCFSLVGKIR